MRLFSSVDLYMMCLICKVCVRWYYWLI